jgi:hypothetical protein
MGRRYRLEGDGETYGKRELVDRLGEWIDEKLQEHDRLFVRDTEGGRWLVSAAVRLVPADEDG